MAKETKAQKAEAEAARLAALTPEEREAEEAKALASGSPKSKAGNGVVTVGFIDPKIGQTTREFSQEVHGDDFEEVANTFVETHKDKGAVILEQ